MHLTGLQMDMQIRVRNEMLQNEAFIQSCRAEFYVS